jgi:hypothetical protein
MGKFTMKSINYIKSPQPPFAKGGRESRRL